MIYIENDRTDPWFNLAVEEFFLCRSPQPEPVVLLWRNSPVVVVGRNQNTCEEINQPFLKEHGIGVVRRLSGGGAVYHDLGNLNFTFIMPDDGHGLDFRFFTEPVIQVLREWGVAAEISGRNDIVVQGKKVSGNAQARYRGRVLHHGTLLFQTDLETMVSALHVDPDKIRSHAVASIRNRVANIADFLSDSCLTRDENSVDKITGKKPDCSVSVKTSRGGCDRPGTGRVINGVISREKGMEKPGKITSVSGLMEEFSRRILAKMSRLEQNRFRKRFLCSDEIKEIEKLREIKYKTWEWNFGRSPQFDVRHARRFDWGKLEIAIRVKQGKIADIFFYGDFFTLDSPERLTQKLTGIPFDPEKVAAAVPESLLQEVFPELTLTDFLIYFQ